MACEPYLAPVDVFLTQAEGDLDAIDTVVQPDLLVVCDKTKLIEEGIRGAPDFIIEILSASTALKDQTEKRQLYEAQGVREYWIINPKTLETFIYILTDGKYGLPRTADLKTIVKSAIFPGLGLTIDPEDLR